MAVDLERIRTRALDLLFTDRVSYPYFLSCKHRWNSGQIDAAEFIYRLEHPEEFLQEANQEWLFVRGLGWRTVVTVPIQNGML